ncbi:hypothetical protein BH18VER1_BH18VER1_14370 [soil metagenome]
MLGLDRDAPTEPKAKHSKVENIGSTPERVGDRFVDAQCLAARPGSCERFPVQDAAIAASRSS